MGSVLPRVRPPFTVNAIRTQRLIRALRSGDATACGLEDEIAALLDAIMTTETNDDVTSAVETITRKATVHDFD